jgi:hypothetical protein
MIGAKVCNAVKGSALMENVLLDAKGAVDSVVSVGGFVSFGT